MQQVPSEAPYEKPENKPEDWPKAGKVEFRHYSTRYRPELDLVLKDINVVIVCLPGISWEEHLLTRTVGTEAKDWDSWAHGIWQELGE